MLHVLGAIAYGFVVLRVASWLPRESRLAAVDPAHRARSGSSGTPPTASRRSTCPSATPSSSTSPGAANLIKPLGLFFPLSFALVAVALVRLGHRWQGLLVLVAILAWPVAHIGNLPAVAVPVNIALVVAFGSLVWARSRPFS